MSYFDRLRYITNPIKDSGYKALYEVIEAELDFWNSRYLGSGDVSERQILLNRIKFLEKILFNPDTDINNIYIN